MRTAITRRQPRSNESAYRLPASLNVVRAPRRAIAVPVPRQRLLQGRAYRWSLTRTHAAGPDALQFFLSGAASDGDAQDVFGDSLGGYRSSIEADRVGRLITNLPSEVDLLQASRANGVGGSGSIMVVDQDTLRYAAPDGSPGPAATMIDGFPAVLVDGTDPSKWVRVLRSGSSGIYGGGVVEFVEQRNNLFAGADADDAEHTAGSDKYRLVFVRAGHLIQNVKLWIMPLAASAASSGGALGSSGSGTITSNTANAFATWPWKGWAYIETSGGSLREIVYYSSRTASTLTVPSLGRERLGTSAAAGATDDVIYPVPPFRIAWELASPAVGGPVQTIADEDTSPTGLSWSTAITAATGIAVGTLAASEQGGLWLHRELPAGVSASPIHDCRLGVQYDVLAATYTETLAGLFRIADDSLEGYELRLGVDAPPALSDAPVATSPTLPITHSGLLAGHEYHAALDRRNRWDVLAQSIQATIVRMTADGGVRPAPAAPYSITWRPGSGGVFSLEAFYSRYSDQIYDAAATPPGWIDNADSWLIYARYDGTNPDPSTDTPTVVAMAQVDNIERFTWTSAAKTAGTVGKVIVRTRRSASVSGEADDVDSTNVDVYTATAVTAGPSGNRLRGFQRRNAEIL